MEFGRQTTSMCRLCTCKVVEPTDAIGRGLKRVFPTPGRAPACIRRGAVGSAHASHTSQAVLAAAQLGNDGSTSTIVKVVPSCTSVWVTPVGCRKVSDG